MGKRIGLIADNHSRTDDGSDVPDGVLRAFDGADLILHLGDAGSWGTLDRLATIAPVVAVLGGHNGMDPDTRVGGLTRIETIEGLRVGMVHDLVTRGVTSESAPALRFIAAPRAALRTVFAEDVDVLTYAGTHVPRIAWADGMLLVNPGSPTLPNDRPKGSLGRVALIEIDDGVASAWVVDLAG
jgi:putative phosphoesterase